MAEESLRSDVTPISSVMAPFQKWGELHRQLRDCSPLKDCSICGDETGRFEIRDVKEANVPLSGIVEAANRGCQSCLLVCLALEYFDMLWTSSKNTPVRLIPLKSPSVGLITAGNKWKEVRFYVRPRDKFRLPAFLPQRNHSRRLHYLFDKSLKSISRIGPLWEDLAPSLDIDQDSSSAATFDKIHEWLLSCATEHPKCLSSPSPLPTRVVDVGKGTAATVSCRLYESHGEYASYMTLSHSWGKDSGLVLKTFMSTLEEHKKSIPWHSLSKTFQDAVVVTRKLGIRYIWIDSLCIVQDDIADWGRESGNMANIYQNSHLTLAATASFDGSGGLFVERDGNFFEAKISLMTLFQAPAIRARRALLHESLDPSDECDPLPTRAWAYQERLLARRIVHFSSTELLWECRSKEACECGDKDNVNFGIVTSYAVNVKAAYGNMLSSNPQETGFDGWHQLVQVYTQLHLTFERDRLPALSGIASRLFQETQYLAGLRRHHLLKDLFWKPNLRDKDDGAFINRRPLTYRAPSWSWASVEGPVCWWAGSQPAQSTPEIEDFTVIDAACTPTAGPFGAVSSGYLILQAVVLEATLLPLAVSSDMSNDHEPQTSYEDSIRHPTRSAVTWGSFEPDVSSFDTSYLVPQSISLLIARSVSDGGIWGERFAMIVLKKSLGTEATYERIGRAHYFGPVPFSAYAGTWEPSVIKII